LTPFELNRINNFINLNIVSFDKKLWFPLMVLGPVPAITEALKKAGLSLNDMDLVEVCSQWGKKQTNTRNK